MTTRRFILCCQHLSYNLLVNRSECIGSFAGAAQAAQKCTSKYSRADHSIGLSRLTVSITFYHKV